MGSDGARTAAMGHLLEPHEKHDTRSGRTHPGRHCPEALGPAEHEYHRGHRVPEPAVAATGGANHPKTNPARGAPTVYAVHHAVVPPGDEVQHSLRKRAHADTFSVSQDAGKPSFLTEIIRSNQVLANNASTKQFTRITAGTAARRGARAAVQGDSFIIPAQMVQTSQVRLEKPPDSPWTIPLPARIDCKNSSLFRAPGAM